MPLEVAHRVLHDMPGLLAPGRHLGLHVLLAPPLASWTTAGNPRAAPASRVALDAASVCGKGSGRRVVWKDASVTQTPRPHARQRREGVLARDCGVPPLRLAGDGLASPMKSRTRSKRWTPMSMIASAGRSRDRAARIDVPACRNAKRPKRGVPRPPRAEFQHPHEGPLPAEVLVDHEARAGRLAGRDHGTGVLQPVGDGLLADDHARPWGRKAPQARDARGRRRDVDEVRASASSIAAGSVKGSAPNSAAMAAPAVEVADAAILRPRAQSRQACMWLRAKKPAPISAPRPRPRRAPQPPSASLLQDHYTSSRGAQLV
jgi:hypothetical protein